jgi:isoprenylcysteine carboxyl methyltransferase (ICMT) family protein YpbQ
MNTTPIRQESNVLYTVSLFVLIALTALCLAVSAADVIIQALADKNQYGQRDYRNLFVVGGSYALMVSIYTTMRDHNTVLTLYLILQGLLAFIFSCSRLFTVRRSLADIPKLHIPISEYDLPKVSSMYRFLC